MNINWNIKVAHMACLFVSKIRKCMIYSKSEFGSSDYRCSWAGYFLSIEKLFGSDPVFIGRPRKSEAAHSCSSHLNTYCYLNYSVLGTGQVSCWDRRGILDWYQKTPGPLPGTSLSSSQESWEDIQNTWEQGCSLCVGACPCACGDQTPGCFSTLVPWGRVSYWSQSFCPS